MAEAECYVACHPEAMLLNPYESQFNCAYHVKFTGPEILAALDSIKPDFLVTGNSLHTDFGFDSTDLLTGDILFLCSHTFMKLSSFIWKKNQNSVSIQYAWACEVNFSIYVLERLRQTCVLWQLHVFSKKIWQRHM